MSTIKPAAIRQLEKEFGLSKKKIASTSTLVTHWSIPSNEWSQTDIGHVVRDAILSATTSPFLRAIAVIVETEFTKEVKFFEMEEDELSAKEKVGALLCANEKIKALKELGTTHVLKASSITPSIFSFIKESKAKNAHILNIHHDYIRSFFDTPIDTSELIWNILEKGIEPRVMVIRNLREEDQHLPKNKRANGGNEIGNGDTSGILENT